MRLAIVSDIHANLEALRATLDDVGTHGVDRIVCLGDVVGYNANPAECVALLREAGPVCVAGNHDRAVLGHLPTTEFEPPAARAIPWTRQRLGPDALEYLARLPLVATVEGALVAVHGALRPDGSGCERTRLSNDARRLGSFGALARHASGARVCAFGHTHRLGVYEWREGEAQVRACPGDEVSLRPDAYYLMNPGTVGHPRREAGDDATYLVLDTDRQRVTVRRVRYDRAAALAKARAAGLAPGRSLRALLPEPVRLALYRAVKRSGLRRFVTRFGLG